MTQRRPEGEAGRQAKAGTPGRAAGAGRAKGMAAGAVRADATGVADGAEPHRAVPRVAAPRAGADRAVPRAGAGADRAAPDAATAATNAATGAPETGLGRVRRKSGVGPVRRKTRHDGWTQEKRALFLDELKAGCNVREAVRAAGMSDVSAYGLRKRDPAFAAEWAEALEQGYAELEMALLRQAIHGSATTETVEDGASGARRTRTVHSYPHAMALRLLLAHRAQVAAYRDAQGIDRCGTEAVRAEIQQRLAETRARLLGTGAEAASEAGAAAGAAHTAGAGPDAVASEEVLKAASETGASAVHEVAVHEVGAGAIAADGGGVPGVPGVPGVCGARMGGATAGGERAGPGCSGAGHGVSGRDVSGPDVPGVGAVGVAGGGIVGGAG